MKRTLPFLLAGLLIILLVGCTNNGPGTSSSASVSGNTSTSPFNNGTVSNAPGLVPSISPATLPGILPSGQTSASPGISSGTVPSNS